VGTITDVDEATLVLHRHEALAAVWLLTDILTELKEIKRLLQNGEEDETDEQR
jgi:hypothetical protein